jgi:hypothetical protein
MRKNPLLSLAPDGISRFGGMKRMGDKVDQLLD